MPFKRLADRSRSPFRSSRPNRERFPTAQVGKAGLEQIRSGAHDIILSDVRMPQVSGLDTLTAAREQDPMTPVILTTAQASLQSAISAVNSGAFYYIQKPFSNDELVA